MSGGALRAGDEAPYVLTPEEEAMVRELEEAARHVRIVPPGTPAGPDVLDPVKYGFPIGMDDEGNLFPTRPRPEAEPAPDGDDGGPAEPE